MKFPVPKTLRGAYAPIVMLNSIFGIGIMQFPAGRPRPILSALWSLANFLIHLGFVLMTNFEDVIEIQGSKIAANNYRANAYFCVLFIGIFLCVAHINAKTTLASLVNISSINERLKTMGIPDDYDVFFKSLLFQKSVGFALFLIILVLDFNYVDFQFPTETSRLGFLLSFHYLLGFSFAVDSSLSCNVRYFRNRFRRLNTLLVQSDSPEKNTTFFTSQSDNQLPQFPWVMNEIFQNHSLSLKAVKKQSLLYVIRETRKMHRRLVKTAMGLNRAFGLLVLLSLTLSTGLITTLFYTSYILAATSSSASSDPNRWIVRFIALTWIMCYVMKVFMIIQAIESTTTEAKRTRELISKLLDSSAYDEDIRNEINIFSLQLIQNPLIFTAHGFFQLDYGLLCKIIGSVTTYLIIMIQMQSVYETDKINSTF